MSEEKKIRVPPELKSGSAYAPKESMAEVQHERKKLFIGIPKENTYQENRIALTPESVAILTGQNHRIVVESNAGAGSFFSDTDFSEAGAEIAESPAEVYQAGIILKVAPPGNHEFKLLKANQIVISPLHLPAITQDYLQDLISKRVTALAYEYIQDESETFPLVSSMSEIAGSSAVLIAAQLLSNLEQGKGILLGGVSGVPPAQVVILGAGTVGENAARTALALGAEVRVFDNNLYKLKRLQQNVGARIYTSIIHNDVLSNVLATADVVVGAVHSKSGRSPVIVSEELVSRMKSGSVIVDVSIDQGGCFETSELTSHSNPVFKKYDVIHYCVPNIASRVSRTASQAISNILTPMLIEASELGGFDRLLFEHDHIRNGVYVYRGCLTNLHLSQRFSMKFTNLELLFPSGM